jgi:type IV fimbrial biogenesis protein FimT
MSPDDADQHWRALLGRHARQLLALSEVAMRRRCLGISLVELLVVLVLAGILLGAAAPAYQHVMRRLQLSVAVNDLVAAIDLTRSQAITLGRPVMLVPLEPNGTDWRQGWVVFVDSNGNRRPDVGEARIFQHGPLPDGMTLESAFSSAGTPLYFAYNGAGRSCSAGNSLAARWGTLSLAQGREVRNIKINMLGRLRVCDPAIDTANCDGVGK